MSAVRTVCLLSGLALLACTEPTPLESPAVGEVPEMHRSHATPVPPATLGWQELARSLVASNSVAPLPAARAYALVSLAQYGALTDQSNDEDERRDGRHSRAFQRGAVAGASSVVLAYVFPASATALEQRVADEQAAVGTPDFAQGVEQGRIMGNRMVAWGRADRSDVPFTGTIPEGPGLWTRNPAPPGGALPPIVGPTFGEVAPYTLKSGSQFRPAPPPAFNSPEFLANLAEIRSLSDTRTPEQLAIAVFWNLPLGTPTPPGYWNQVASDLIVERGLSEKKATHVFALLDAAMVDAAIGCWDAKFYYWYIRPWQADAAITTPIGRPNHPSYPSGHSCVSAAATTVLAHFFPKQKQNLQDQLEEAGLSRMYGGIHYRFDIDAGQQLGKSVGRYAIRFDHRNGLLARIP